MDCRERRREREREREKERERETGRGRDRERERMGDGKRGDGRKRIYLYFAHPQDAPGARVATRCARLPRGGGVRRRRRRGGGRAGGRERGWEGLIRDGRRTVATYVRARRET